MLVRQMDYFKKMILALRFWKAFRNKFYKFITVFDTGRTFANLRNAMFNLKMETTPLGHCVEEAFSFSTTNK